jgi:(p)ppGpp synthase/HD superfamily hydrolase
MSTLEKAIEIAARAHTGQVDKAGSPYILHPLRLMLAVRHPHERMAAVLHDVVEDTSVTLDDLRAAGFPTDVLEAVDALTKRKGESRLDAAKRAVRNPIARVVKLADVADNMDLTRLSNPSESDFARLKEYEQVRALLQAGPV